jgi:hypothetical protein
MRSRGGQRLCEFSVCVAQRDSNLMLIPFYLLCLIARGLNKARI